MNVYIGIDWGVKKHDVVVLRENGRRLLKFVMPQAQAGFLKLPEQCHKHGLELEDCYVAIESSYLLLMDFLWSYGFGHVYVIPPSVVKASRSRYTSSGARNDDSDAYLLADLLRTDRHRFTPWQPDSPLTCRMRCLVNLLQQLTRSATSLSNQLRTLLLRYYPAMVELFPCLTAKTALAFLCAYPTPQDAAALDAQTLRHFLRQQHYPCPKKLLPKLPQLLSPTLHTTPATAQAYAYPAVTLAHQLALVVEQKDKAQAQLTALFRQHPDHDTFASLPGAGPLLAPALLVHFGDHRERFPSAAAVQALAGTVPVTSQSGKARRVHFRRACNRQFRFIITQLAAVAYYDDLRSRGKSEHLAYRCLANHLLRIAWKLWRTHTAYDEAFHTQQRLARQQPKSEARSELQSEPQSA